MKLFTASYCIDDIDCHFFSLQEEVKEVSPPLSIHGHNIKVTEALKDGDTLTFLIVSQKVRKFLNLLVIC